jgi:hypothetical protein
MVLWFVFGVNYSGSGLYCEACSSLNHGWGSVNRKTAFLLIHPHSKSVSTLVSVKTAPQGKFV